MLDFKVDGIKCRVDRIAGSEVVQVYAEIGDRTLCLQYDEGADEGAIRASFAISLRADLSKLEAKR